MGWDIQSVTGKQNIYYPFEPKERLASNFSLQYQP